MIMDNQYESEIEIGKKWKKIGNCRNWKKIVVKYY